MDKAVNETIHTQKSSLKKALRNPMQGSQSFQVERNHTNEIWFVKLLETEPLGI